MAKDVTACGWRSKACRCWLWMPTGDPSQAENLYTEPLLRAAFADMDILHLHEHDDIIEEGAGHCGMSALIDLVTRKI
jgi:hypothetical protein